MPTIEQLVLLNDFEHVNSFPLREGNGRLNETFNAESSKHRMGWTNRSISIPREAILAELAFQGGPRDAQNLASLASMSASKRPNVDDVAALHFIERGHAFVHFRGRRRRVGPHGSLGLDQVLLEQQI